MTRPDARLLVPVASLPGGRAPVGATVWDGDVRGVVTARRHRSGETEVAFENDTFGRVPTTGLHLNLSRPDVVGGVPVRLDALGWALGVLGQRLGESEINRVELERFPGWEAIHLSHNTETLATVANHPAYGRRHRLDPWPDLSGLSDDDASRAVVAAALRGGA